MLNAITIDVEEWFHVSRFRKHIDPADWGKQQSRVVPSVARVLQILEEHNVRATFFVLAWVAEQHPEIVQLILKDGHDIGTHGYAHQLIYTQTPTEFSQDIEKSLKIIGDIAGQTIDSYRAPSFSINQKSLWAFEVLSDHGIKIDSSLFPVKHDLYGGIQSPVEFFKVPVNGSGSITECPLATRNVGDRAFPIAGGGYLRMFPLWFLTSSIKLVNKMGRAAVIYFHPWEIDEVQPRVHAGFKDRFLHYNNIDQTEKKLHSLLETFSFSTLSDVVEQTDVTQTWPKW